MTLSEAKKQQSVMQYRATTLLKDYKIKDLFSSIGDLVSVGSYSYGLMVIPDIDFSIYCENPLVFNEKVVSITNILMDKSGVTKISISKSGLYMPSEDGKPKGIWIGINIFFYGYGMEY